MTEIELIIYERNALIAAYKEALDAYTGLMDGRITSYTLGHRSITRNTPDLKTLDDWLEKTRLRIGELTALIMGEPRRYTTTCVYGNPMNIRHF